MAESTNHVKAAGQSEGGSCRQKSPDLAEKDYPDKGLSRRDFLVGLGAAGMGALAASSRAQGAPAAEPVSETGLPTGRPLKVKPALTYQIENPSEKTSWRSYGGLQSMAEVQAEATRIEEELKALASRAEFPVEILPLSLVADEKNTKEAAASDCDTLLLYAANGWQVFPLTASSAPAVMFLRHKSGPYYLWHEIAHWRFLRRSGDTIEEPNVDIDDIVVDDYNEVLWRLRSLYGLKNARGTKMLAIGSLAAYSEPGQQLGPPHAKEVWAYEIEVLPREEFARRLGQARTDEKVMKEVHREVDQFLAQRNLTLQTDRKFVINSFLAYRVCKELLAETGATNFGFDHCMGRDVIEMLDTPPCLVLSLANDEGYTAYCHTDLTHTVAGVLLRWIASKPTFVCNSHFPHHGIFTVAHCAAPRRMSGRHYEPATIMTHFESDYGAATKVHYTKDQLVTVIIPNLRCTKWQGFTGRILDSPSHPACRSQMDIEVHGDFRKLLTEMEGFHVQVCYGNYLREVGYALKKLKKIQWQNFSEA
jgi:hypothetical protein